MEKKFRMSPRELILSSKNYSDFTKEELIIQYEIIMIQYDAFKSQMTADIILKPNSPIANIQNMQKRTQQNMFSNMLNEVDSHLKIISDLIDSM